MSVKLSDLVSKFSGDGSQDILEWLKKLELIASLQNIDGLARFVPLFLVDAAFAVYDQMKQEDKNSYKKIKEVLKSAFSLTPCQAYEEFKRRELKTGETPDGYLADLRRLLQLIGCESDEMLLVQFISGLPSKISSQVKAMKADEMNVSAVLQYTKSIISETQSHSMCFVANDKKVSQNSVKCWGCGSNHIKRYCKVRCSSCCQYGHDAAKINSNKFCYKNQGNEEGNRQM